MPNKPASGTVTVSFTLPRMLAEQVELISRRQLTNKSELIRRALMEYLPDDVRLAVENAIVKETPASYGQSSSGKKGK